MKNIKWILQTNIFNEKSIIKMKDSFKKNNIEYDEIQIIPFSDQPLLNNSEYYNQPVIVYGTTTLIKYILKDSNIKPGIYILILINLRYLIGQN